MDISQLRAFAETARQGSFSAAAASLGLTQPGVSRQVKQIEQELGFVLIDREQRPISLTPAGEDFLACAETILKELDATIQRLANGQVTPRGTIVVAASTIPGEFFVPRILAKFSARYPRVQPNLVITDSAGVVERLLAREAEIGFLGAHIAYRRLRLIPFAEDEIVLVVPTGHPFAETGKITLADLGGQPIVEREGGSGTLGSLKRILAQRGVSLPEHRVAMVAGTSQAQLAAIEAGVGVGFVSGLALASRSASKLAGVEIEGVRLRRTLYLAHDRAPLLPIAQALVDLVIEQKQ
ncbi:MAG: LysR family transcriptional regulator [Chloroflexi bacterium]|nr:LysR family transcriptional regulator [Chloroflexota bacterium]